MSDPVYLTRKQAAAVVEGLRLGLAHIDAGRLNDGLGAMRDALRKAGLGPLTRCDGEAHGNAHIDN